MCMCMLLTCMHCNCIPCHSSPAHARMEQCDVLPFPFPFAAVKARAESESTTINAFISQDLEIVCKALGNSGAPELMVFVWRRNGQALRIEPLGTVNGHAMDQFILRNITEADAGTYECHPENTVGGQNFTSYTIQVRPIEPPAISNVDVTSVPPNDSYVTVCWDSEDYTGKVIDHYVVEILLVTSRDAEVIKSVNVPAWQNCTNISIPEATPGSRYGARINAIGRGGLRLTDTTEYTLETEPGRVGKQIYSYTHSYIRSLIMHF